jgi:hypothetical protein
MMCYLNITNPALYESCSDRPDTFEYMYSIPGFDPCHPLDFTQKFNLQFYANCKFLLPGTRTFESTDTKLGVSYPNVITADEEDFLDMFNNRPDDYWED